MTVLHSWLNTKAKVTMSYSKSYPVNATVRNNFPLTYITFKFACSTLLHKDGIKVRLVSDEKVVHDEKKFKRR
jgi:hypothetical protein